MRTTLFHGVRISIPNWKPSPNRTSIGFSQIAFSITVLPKDNHTDFVQEERLDLPYCGEVEEVVSVLTPVSSGVAQVCHVLLVELQLLLVAEVDEGEEEDRQEEGWEVESGVGRVKENIQSCMAWRWV